MKELKWPTVREVIRCETATSIFKFMSVTNFGPDYLSHMFMRNFDRSNINLRNAETDLLVPFIKTSIKRRAFAFHRAKTWNELICKAKKASSLYSFKNKIKC